MIGGLAILLICQLIGELIAALLRLPIPGPVIGMILLFCGLLLRYDRPKRDGPQDPVRRGSGKGRDPRSRRERPGVGGDPSLPEGLESAAQGLLQHLALMFVPAGTGIIAYVALIQEEWLAITVALVGSTILTLIVTGTVLQAANRRRRGNRSEARSG